MTLGWRIAVGVATALGIALVFLVMVAASGARVSDYTPYWSDETKNWSAIRTFAQAGFDAGYYSINESTPLARFSRFGPHGPWVPALYGSAARVTGWTFITPLIYNFVALAGAVIVYFALVDLPAGSTRLASALLLTFWPITISLPAVMQECLHLAIAMLVAVLLGPWLERPRSRRSGYLLLAVLVFASLIRVSWALIFLPAVWYGHLSSSRAPWRLLTAGLLVLASVAVFAIVVPANPTGPLGAPGSLAEAAEALAGNLRTSARLYWPEADPAQVALAIPRLLLPLLVVLIALRASHRFASTGALAPRERRDLGALLWILVPVLVLSLLLANIGTGKDYRLWAPHLLLGALLLLRRAETRWIAAVVVAVNVATAPFALEHFRAARGPNYAPLRGLAEARQAFAPVAYREGLDPWCNTIFVVPEDPALRRLAFLTAPAGVGVSVKGRGLEPPSRLKSHYLLLARDPPPTEVFPDQPTVERAWLGSVVQNPASACPEPASTADQSRSDDRAAAADTQPVGGSDGASPSE